ncbi:hypothetical protein BGZ94_005309 [Podila epigama]|nr:hypothetical protein BGZ94_005309 [Podila epigama]
MTPCLLFTKIASTINWTQFVAFWPIPVFYILFSGVSMAVAKVGSRLLGFSKDEEKFVTASILFSNTNSLPMALLQSLAFSAAGDRLLRDENDTKMDVAARGISYILFYAIFGNLVRWSYGFTLLVPKDKDEVDSEAEDVPVLYHPQPRHPPQGILIDVDRVDGPSSRRSDASSLTLPSIYRTDFDEGNTTAAASMTHDRSSAHPAFNNANTNATNNHSHQKHVNRDNTVHPLSLPVPVLNPVRSTAPSPNGSTRSFLYQKSTSAFERVRQVLTPPLMTALIALFIGLVPTLHKLFMSPESTVYRFLIKPIENCGEAAIPMILLCLGAQVVNFAAESAKNDKITDANIQAKTTKNKKKNKKPINHASYPSAQTGLGIYTTDDQGTGTGQNEPYGGGIATLKSNASSSDTLLHFSNSNDPNATSRHRRGDDSSSSRQTSVQRYDINDRVEYEDDDEDDHDEALPLISDRSRVVDVDDDEDYTDDDRSSPRYRVRWLTPIPYILIARMLLVPLISLPAILFHPESLSPILTMDPTFSLTLVLLAAAPTAINMIQICQIKGFFEHEMAAVLFWSYCVFGIPCVLGWSLVGLWAAGR